jgi:hypothetical protein
MVALGGSGWVERLNLSPQPRTCGSIWDNDSDTRQLHRRKGFASPRLGPGVPKTRKQVTYRAAAPAPSRGLALVKTLVKMPVGWWPRSRRRMRKTHHNRLTPMIARRKTEIFADRLLVTEERREAARLRGRRHS